MVDSGRRTTIAGIAAATTSALAGCSSVMDGVTGPEYEAGDEQAVMLEASYFGDGWAATGRADESAGNGGDGGLLADLGYEAGDAPTARETFERESGGAAVTATVAILDSADDAAAAVDGIEERQFDDADAPAVGDGATRGETNGIAVVACHLANALVATGALEYEGLDVQPDPSRALDVAEELEGRLEDR